jgi:hypothetical protein
VLFRIILWIGWMVEKNPDFEGREEGLSAYAVALIQKS